MIQIAQIKQGFQPFLQDRFISRVQSATMRELDEDDSIESLKGKNQKVRNLIW